MASGDSSNLQLPRPTGLPGLPLPGRREASEGPGFQVVGRIKAHINQVYFIALPGAILFCDYPGDFGAQGEGRILAPPQKLPADPVISPPEKIPPFTPDHQNRNFPAGGSWLRKERA